jgi:hypothetical protein
MQWNANLLPHRNRVYGLQDKVAIKSLQIEFAIIHLARVSNIFLSVSAMVSSHG